MAIGFRTSGMFGKQPMPQQPAPQQAMPIGIQQMTAKPKFFGEGGVGRAIAGNIGDFLLQQAGMDPIYLPNVLQQRDAAERARMEQQRQRQQRENFLFEEGYKRANAKPDEPKDQLTRFMVAAGIDPNSPRARELYARAVENEVNPIQAVPFTDERGNSGQMFIRPGQMQGGQSTPAAPTSKEAYDALPPGAQYRAPDGSLRTKGGAGGNASGGFR